MEEWRKPKHFVLQDNSEKQRRLKEDRSRPFQAAGWKLAHKRQLEAVLMENAVLKKAKSKREVHVEIDKGERNRAEWAGPVVVKLLTGATTDSPARLSRVTEQRKVLFCLYKEQF